MVRPWKWQAGLRRSIFAIWKTATSISGSSGFTFDPRHQLAFSGGKEGVGYLVDRDNMGGLTYGNTDTNILQTLSDCRRTRFTAGWCGGICPSGSFGYTWPASVHLQQYKFDRTTNRFVLPAFANSATVRAGRAAGGHARDFGAWRPGGFGNSLGRASVDWRCQSYGAAGFLHAYRRAKYQPRTLEFGADSVPRSRGEFCEIRSAHGGQRQSLSRDVFGTDDVYGLAAGWVAAPTITPGGGAFTNSTMATARQHDAGSKNLLHDRWKRADDEFHALYCAISFDQHHDRQSEGVQGGICGQWRGGHDAGEQFGVWQRNGIARRVFFKSGEDVHESADAHAHPHGRGGEFQLGHGFARAGNQRGQFHRALDRFGAAADERYLYFLHR